MKSPATWQSCKLLTSVSIALCLIMHQTIFLSPTLIFLVSPFYQLVIYHGYLTCWSQSIQASYCLVFMFTLWTYYISLISYYRIFGRFSICISARRSAIVTEVFVSPSKQINRKWQILSRAFQFIIYNHTVLWCCLAVVKPINKCWCWSKLFHVQQTDCLSFKLCTLVWMIVERCTPVRCTNIFQM
jgi:hypothetical protein